MFQQIAKLLVAGEEIRMSVARLAGEQVKVILTPVLKGDGKDLDDASAQARAALAQPLVLRGTAEKIDTAFGDLLDGYGEVRAEAAAIGGTTLEKMRSTVAGAAKSKAEAADKKPATTTSNPKAVTKKKASTKKATAKKSAAPKPKPKAKAEPKVDKKLAAQESMTDVFEAPAGDADASVAAPPESSAEGAAESNVAAEPSSETPPAAEASE